MASLLESVFSLIAPHECLVCEREGRVLCQWCTLEYVEPLPSCCYMCRRVTKESATCLKCRPKTALSHVWVNTPYRGVAQSLVHALKFRFAQSASLPMAEQLHAQLPFLPEDTIITFVPAATDHVRQRGYDQARSIAKEFAKLRDFRVTPTARRHGHKHQFGANRKTRLSQLADVFTPFRPENFTGRTVLIIDDVLTTGATLETLAKVLKKAGAKRIDAAVFAQKL